MDNARVFARVIAVVGEYDDQQTLTHRVLTLEASDQKPLPHYLHRHREDDGFKVRLPEQATREVSVGSWLRVDLAIATKAEAELAQKSVADAAAAYRAEEAAYEEGRGVPLTMPGTRVIASGRNFK
jgi:hypothetical protein